MVQAFVATFERFPQLGKALFKIQFDDEKSSFLCQFNSILCSNKLSSDRARQTFVLFSSQMLLLDTEASDRVEVRIDLLMSEDCY